MPRTINEGFGDFLKKLTPTTTETTAAKKHRASIESCLKTNFGMVRFFRTGSFGNGTSVSGYSDVDYFASIPFKNLSGNSKYSVTQVRNQLNITFHSTNVKVDDPAVVCPFGTMAKESTEIVPCYYKRKIKEYSIYGMSDTNEGWKESSPEMHNAYIKQEDTRLNGKLKPLIRFVKAWKFYRNVKISSFHLELRIAKLMKDETTIDYSIDLYTIFKWLEDNNIPAIQDPMGISGLILPCNTAIQKADAVSKIKTARSRIEKARSFERNGDAKSAFAYWNLVYDGKFPSYYK
ncbi:MAG: hypothetical protein QNK23_08535 [Crocinitomicaceae bacterium]|nr:hypothetical protein [Crocinitomicaceae bacterium]